MRRQFSAIFLLLMITATAQITAGDTSDGLPCGGDVDECVAKKRLEFEERGLVGLVLKPQKNLDSGEFQAYWEVGGVIPGSAAEAVGVEVGDRIVGWSDVRLIRDKPDLQQDTISATKVGEEVRLKILRDGELTEKVVTARKPDPQVIEHWLGHYVYLTFGEEAQMEFIEKAKRRLHAGHDH